MFDTDNSLSEARRFLLAAGAALLFSFACLTAAVGPANAESTRPAASPLDRPTLL